MRLRLHRLFASDGLDELRLATSIFDQRQCRDFMDSLSWVGAKILREQYCGLQMTALEWRIF
jgi:hypothetical protein